MKMTRRALVWLSVGLTIVMAGGYSAIPLVFGVPVTPIKVTRGEIVQTIVASGRAETPFRLDIGSQIIGIATRVLVDEGMAVKQGDILIALDDRQRQAAVDEARASVRQAEASLVELAELTLPLAEQRLIEMKATRLNAETQLSRALRLAEQSITSRESVQNLQRAFDVADSEVRSAELSVRSASIGGSGHQAALAALAQAEAALDVAAAQLRMATIRAPVSGTVIARNVEEGAIVEAGRALLVLAPDRPKQLVVQIDERNLNLIRVGQPAVASADAYPDQQFAAVIVAISPAIDADRGSVEVKLSVAEPPAYLKEDMTVSIDVEVARHPDALMVPSDAVRNAASMSPSVLLIVDGRAVLREVTLGASSTTAVEIVAGVAVDDLIIPATATAVTPGQRVRAAEPVVTK
jgi:HlyD family secretion protein